MTAIIERPDFGQYEVLARIGEGAHGLAFIARVRGETDAGSLCIIELSAFASGEDDAARAFARDLERVARIRHRNLVRILELGANTTGRYAAMEYVESCTFAELLDRHRAIRPPRLMLAPILDALDGLHAVHSIEDDGTAQPMLHGSVSPGQLRIGLDGTCRISGFGNLRRSRQTRSSYRNRSAIECAAPEQLTGAQVDHRADLFSIGVVLWNALTGRELFHDPAEHLVMSAVLERKIPRPSTIGLSPPPAFDAIVLRALERDPDRRFQSAAELAGELRDVARGAGCLAGTDEVGQWITTTFGGELAAGRRAILEIAARGPLPPSSPTPEVSVLLRLGAARPSEAAARDAPSPDELSGVTELPSLPDTLSGAPPLRAPIAATRLDHRPRAPRMLVIAAFVAFGAVAIVLGYRWATRRSPAQDVAAVAVRPPPEERAPASPELEVTVLMVRTFVPPSPDAAPPRPDLAPAPTSAPAPPPSAAPSAPVAAPAAAPPRSVARGRRPGRPAPTPAPEVRTPAPARTADIRPEPPDTRAPEPHPAAPPTKPESPSKPALETNPYLYK